jgi:hypothetical protein
MKLDKKVNEEKILYKGSFWSQLGLFLSIPDNTLQYLEILGNTFTILTNTY